MSSQMPDLSDYAVPQDSWLSIREAERKYGLAHGQIAYWIRTKLMPLDRVQDPPRPRAPRLVHEATVQAIVIRDYQPHRPKRSRAVVLPAPTPQGTPTMIPAEELPQHAPVIQAAPQALPPGYMATAELVTKYLEQRAIKVQRGEIAPKTYELDAHYSKRWALHTPVFPWTQQDIDSYDASYGSMPSRHHAMRFVRALTLWTNKRYPGANLPTDIKPGKQVPPQPDVLTPEQEHIVFAALRSHDYALWVYATVLTRTGCRAFELIDQDWETIDAKGFLSRGRAKKRSGRIYFPPGLYDLLLTLPEPHTGPVFLDRTGKRTHSRDVRNRIADALAKVELDFKGPIGSYMFRHLYAARMKDHIRIERLAALMRTSVAMLERTYGKQSDESFEAIITEADQAVWGSAATQSP